MTTGEIASAYASDWFTAAPRFRTRDHLALHILAAITEALTEMPAAGDLALHDLADVLVRHYGARMPQTMLAKSAEALVLRKIINKEPGVSA